MRTPKLIIVDQSLRDANGHHYEYDVSIAQAAGRLGMPVLIVAHKDCDKFLLSVEHPIRRYFKQAWNETHQGPLIRVARSVLSLMPPGLRTTVITASSGMRRRLHGLAVVTPSDARPLPLPSFGRELSELVDAECLDPTDHILIHTLSVPELHSLIAAFAQRPSLPKLHIVLRRDADEPAVRAGPWGGIKTALALVSAHQALRDRLQFYSDTEHLCLQYEAVSAGLPIRLLPIPHGLPPSLPSNDHVPRRPVCATYIGNARTEKGFHHLPQAVETLHRIHIATGLLRFVIQANASLSLEEPVIASARRRLAAYSSTEVELINHSLSIAEFGERLLQSDLILLPYQPDAYRKRSSGILVQALVCGIPVVIPSGTWLSDAAPPGAAVTYDTPDGLAAAIRSAVERLPDLQSAARMVAPIWRATHNSDALLKCLLTASQHTHQVASRAAPC